MFKSAATKIAHNSTVPVLGVNKDLKTLQDLITSEKSVLQALQRLAVDLSKSAEALQHWGNGEGDDLGNTLTAATVLLMQYAAALSRFSSHEASIREHMKAVRTREENLDELKRRRKSLASKADSAEKKLSRMNSENKNLQSQTDMLNRLREEIRIMDTDIMNEEASIGDFKRQSARTWMGHKFGGLQECCEKGLIVAELGKLIIAEIPTDPTQPGLPRQYYTGHARTEFLVAEAQRSLQEVVFSPDPSPNSSSRTIRALPGVELPPLQAQSSFQPSQYPPQSRPTSAQYAQGADTSTSSFTAPGSPRANRISQGPGSLNSNFVGLPQVPQTPIADFGLGGFLSSDQQSQAPPTSPPQPQLYPISTQEYAPQPEPYPQQPPQSQYRGHPEISEFGSYNAGNQYAARTTSLRNIGEGQNSPPISPIGGPRGRFATFPTKGGPRPPPGAAPPAMVGALRMEDRPPSLDVDRPHDSFSSSIAEALGNQWDSDVGRSNGPQAPDAKQPAAITSSTDAKRKETEGEKHRSTSPPPPPMYSAAANDFPYAPPQPSQPQSAAGMAPPSAPAPQIPPPMQQQEQEETDTALAYLSDPGGNESVSSREGPDRGDRMVRFGSVRDVDQEMEKRAKSEQTHLEAQQASNEVLSPPLSTSPPPRSPTDVSAEHAQSTVSPLIITPHRAPTPSDDTHTTDEKSLNAAAAREVSRELDALMFNSPMKPYDLPSASVPEPNPRTSSPLLPPQPPFARNSTSPRPETMPISSDGPLSPTHSLRNEPHYIRERDRSSVSPTLPSGGSGRFSPPQTPSEAPPTISLSGRSISPTGGTSFHTPPEYPIGSTPMGPGSFYAHPTTTGSASSFTPGEGARKISAAAFKRQIRPLGSSTMSPSSESGPGLADVTPLLVKKRPLPNSPYQVAGQLTPGGSAMQRVPSAPSYGSPIQDNTADWRNRSSSATYLPNEEDTRGQRRPPPIDPGEAGAGGRGGEEDEDDFDYISAYVNSPGSAPNGNGLR